MGFGKILKSLAQIPPKLICAIKFIKNFYFCAFFYALKIFGYILYLPFMIMILIFKLKAFEKIFWKTVKMVDNLFASIFFGLRFASFPDSIMNACFRCKKMKNKKKKKNNLGKSLEKIFANKDSFNFAFVLLLLFAVLFSFYFLYSFYSYPNSVPLPLSPPPLSPLPLSPLPLSPPPLSSPPLSPPPLSPIIPVPEPVTSLLSIGKVDS